MSKQDLASFYRQLSTLVASGISNAEALSRLSDTDIPASAPSSKAAELVQVGKPLHVALSTSGLCSRFQREMLRISEEAGRSSQALSSIAEQLENSASAYSKTKSQLLLPFATLIIAIIVSALLQIARDPNDIYSTAFVALIQIGLAAWLTSIIANLVKREALDILERFQPFIQSNWYQQVYELTFLSLLNWQARSGIDFSKACNSISQLFKKRELSQPIRRAGTFCKKGDYLSEALEKAALPISNEAKTILKTAEKSGTLELSLQRFIAISEEGLRLQKEHALAWLPRIYYCLVVILVVPVIF